MTRRSTVLVRRLRERLWFRPLMMGLLSVAAAFLVKTADLGVIPGFVPNISPETIQTLLTVLSASMLVIATFAVGSMVASYASAATTATPRSFPLVIADDVSQNALSTFIGAFIFSIVALIALLNGFYGEGGRFALFLLTVVVLAAVVLTFLRWVDRIARLGRLETTIGKVETAAAKAIDQRKRAPNMGGVPMQDRGEEGTPVHGEEVGYVRGIDVPRLQEYAEEDNVRIVVDALPGTFSVPGKALAFITGTSDQAAEIDHERISDCFEIGDDRNFDEDPRFGVLVLSEIASRALSPAVNDPGTAIDIIGTLVRLFVTWSEPVEQEDEDPQRCDRVEVPELSIHDLFDDAFRAVARDGADIVEVGVRLQKGLRALREVGDAEMREAARHQARLAIARAEQALDLPEDLELVRSASMVADRSA